MHGMTLLLILLLTVLVMAAGCTSSAPQTTTTQTTTGQPDSSPAAAGSAPASSGSSSGKAMDVKTLNALFPAAPAGWTVTQQPTGSTRLDSDNNAWSASSAIYTSTANKDTTASLTFQDTVGRKVGLKTIWSTFSNTENSDSYFRSSTIKGNPAWETHSIAGKTFKTWILVNDRFMVQVSIENGSQADYDTFINAINFAGIK
ncbi:MAG: hypothetical protein WC620_05190 [Methanoregula sp.]|jgi:hypothetical protein